VYRQLIQQNPGFTRLWLSQIVSLLGDWFSTIVLAVMVQRFTQGTGYSGLAVSGLFLAQSLPPLLASPVAGVLVDRLNRKQLLVWSNLLRVFVVLGFLLVRGPDDLWLLYTLRVLQFFLSSVFEPGQSAIVPSLVKTPIQLNLANTVLSTTWSVMLAVGAVVGGIVGGLYGADTAIIIDAVTFLVAGGLILTIQVGEPVITNTEEDPNATEDRSFAEALRYFGRQPGKIGNLLVKGGGAIGNIDTILTFYATNLFILGAGGELGLGILFSGFGVGAAIGPFLLNRYHGNTMIGLRRMVFVGFGLIVVGWFAFGAAPSLWLAAFAVGLRAMGVSANWVYSTTLIQKSVPDAYLGRAFSLDMGAFYLASVISTPIHGLLIDAFGATHIRIIVYCTALAAGIPLVLWGLHAARQEKHANRGEKARVSS